MISKTELKRVLHERHPRKPVDIGGKQYDAYDVVDHNGQNYLAYDLKRRLAKKARRLAAQWEAADDR